MDFLFHYIVNPLSIFFDGIGVVIIIASSLETAVKYLKKELFNGIQPQKKLPHEQNLRLEYGHKLILGIEFFLAADLIRTVATPTWDAIGKLGALVAIRTVLSFFLTRELEMKKS